MASIDAKTGQIRDRRKGFPQLSYYVPKTSKAFMRECLKAHELMVSLLGRNRALPREELKNLVMRYAVLDDDGRLRLARDAALRGCLQAPGDAEMKDIAGWWEEHKMAESHSSRQSRAVASIKRTIVKSFNEERIETTAGLDCDTALRYIGWRGGKSASTVKKEIHALRQMARIAVRKGYIPNGSLWDDVKVKSIAGVNKKVVEPLPMETQMELLNRLKGNSKGVLFDIGQALKDNTVQSTLKGGIEAGFYVSDKIGKTIKDKEKELEYEAGKLLTPKIPYIDY